ncbi:MAG: DNA repair protein RecO [Chloroflexi bacterium]|nr:DNA repair protein RecO [Chloroflexota bacterium]
MGNPRIEVLDRLISRKLYKTEAIVIKRFNLGEADRVLTLYTPGKGKIRAVAKGVRKPKSKLGGHLETLTHSDLMIAEGQNLDIISQSQTIDSFQSVRNDLYRTSCALYIAELVDLFTAEGLDNYPVYRLLLSTLNWLGETNDIQLTLRYFEIQLLGLLGYRPQLHYCLNCHIKIAPVSNFFSPNAGGIFCPECRNIDPIIRPISLNALKLLRTLQTNEYEQATHIKITPALSQELERLMREYISYRLEREVKSSAFLDQLHKIRPPVSSD